MFLIKNAVVAGKLECDKDFEKYLQELMSLNYYKDLSYFDWLKNLYPSWSIQVHRRFIMMVKYGAFDMIPIQRVKVLSGSCQRKRNNKKRYLENSNLKIMLICYNNYYSIIHNEVMPLNSKLRGLSCYFEAFGAVNELNLAWLSRSWQLDHNTTNLLVPRCCPDSLEQ